MGGGGSKNKAKNIQQPTPPRQQSPIPVEVQLNRSAPESPQLPTVVSPRISVKTHSPSVHSVAPSTRSVAPSTHSVAPSTHSVAPSTHSVAPSTHSVASSTHIGALSTHSQKSKRSITNLPNGSARQSPFRQLENNSVHDSDDEPLTPVNNQLNKSKTHSAARTSTRASTRASSRASTVVPLPQIHRSKAGSNSSSVHNQSVHRKSSATSHNHDGQCSHCPHCQRKRHLHISSTPIPKWITENPGSDQGHILMDKYDIEAVKKKIITENGHLPGSYDYQPQLIMEQTDDYDPTKENYYTQPTLAKLAPSFMAMRTPFPEYEVLQRREQRVNKPNTLSLFDD